MGRRNEMLPAGILRIRTVGAGIRASYIGSTINRKGYFGAAFIPRAATRGGGKAADGTTDMAPLSTHTSFSEDMLKESQHSHIYQDTTETAEVVYLPREDIDYDFLPFSDFRETSISTICGWGLPSEQNCIRWEAIIHVEFIPDPTLAQTRFLSTGISKGSRSAAADVLHSEIEVNPQSVARGHDITNPFMDNLFNSLPSTSIINNTLRSVRE